MRFIPFTVLFIIILSITLLLALASWASAMGMTAVQFPSSAATALWIAPFVTSFFAGLLTDTITRRRGTRWIGRPVLSDDRPRAIRGVTDPYWRDGDDVLHITPSEMVWIHGDNVFFAVESDRNDILIHCRTTKGLQGRISGGIHRVSPSGVPNVIHFVAILDGITKVSRTFTRCT